MPYFEKRRNYPMSTVQHYKQASKQATKKRRELLKQISVLVFLPLPVDGECIGPE